MGCMRNDCIRIEKDGDIIRDEKLFVELFTETYKNIVEILSVKEPSSLRNCKDTAKEDATVDKIISKYSAHLSVQKTKKGIFSR